MPKAETGVRDIDGFREVSQMIPAFENDRRPWRDFWVRACES